MRTPLAETVGSRLANPPLLVPVLRAGLGMVEQAHALIPEARVGFVGVARDEETHQPTPYLESLPDDLSTRPVMVLDPMLATGGSMAHTIGLLHARNAVDITAVCVVCAPEGIAALEKVAPECGCSPPPSTTDSTTSPTSCRVSATPVTVSSGRAERRSAGVGGRSSCSGLGARRGRRPRRRRAAHANLDVALDLRLGTRRPDHHPHRLSASPPAKIRASVRPWPRRCGRSSTVTSKPASRSGGAPRSRAITARLVGSRQARTPPSSGAHRGAGPARRARRAPCGPDACSVRDQIADQHGRADAVLVAHRRRIDAVADRLLVGVDQRAGRAGPASARASHLNPVSVSTCRAP